MMNYEAQFSRLNRKHIHVQVPLAAAVPSGGGGYFLVKGSWGCAAGWGRIFTTGLTIMGLHF